MGESPSSRFCKPILGRVVLQPGEVRHDYIDVGRRSDGTLYYVLNDWQEAGRPRVISERDVVQVEPFGRPTC